VKPGEDGKLPLGQAKARTGRSVATGYSRRYSEYAETFGASERTVKRWVSVGRKSGDEIPLDDPLSVRAWWSRNMSQRCPDGITAAEVAARAAGAISPAAEVPAPPAEEVPSVPSIELAAEEGMAGALKRLEQMEVAFSKLANQPGRAKDWFDSIARMTSLASNVRKEMEAAGLLAPKAEVAEAVRDFMSPIETGIREMYQRFCAILDLAETPEKEAAWSRECDRLFSHWGKELFGNV
jgi:hypothetical protein